MLSVLCELSPPSLQEIYEFQYDLVLQRRETEALGVKGFPQSPKLLSSLVLEGLSPKLRSLTPDPHHPIELLFLLCPGGSSQEVSES